LKKDYAASIAAATKMRLRYGLKTSLLVIREVAQDKKMVVA
jgi:hypothetical protein